MKLTGPLVTLGAGVVLCAIAWANANTGTSTNAGTLIAASIRDTALLYLGGGVTLIGLTWLLVRYLNRPSDE